MLEEMEKALEKDHEPESVVPDVEEELSEKEFEKVSGGGHYPPDLC